VTYLKTLPASELTGWFSFYAEKDRRDKAKKGDLIAMMDGDEDDLVENLKSMGAI